MNHFIFDIDFSYKYIIVLSYVGLFISTSEYIYLHNEFRASGIYSWKILRTGGTIIKSRLVQNIQNAIFSHKGTLVVLLTRLICLSSIFFLTNDLLLSIALIIITATTILFSYRNYAGGDGSDQLNIIILISLSIGILFKSTFIIYNISIGFIACQSCLSYISAGIAKIAGSKWRKGVAAFQIMNTACYGHEKLAHFLHKYPSISFQLSWMIIIMEISFPLCLFLPITYCLFFLIWGILFHLFNSIFMGLNNFFWTFLATYPAIIYTNLALKSHLFTQIHFCR